MCGYVGFWARRSYATGIALADLGLEMAQAIAHRGPDDADVVVESNGLTLAFRRLAIVDLSPAGRQPMASPSGRYLVTFNGEIYNYRELKADLELVGAFAWKGHSDTEVVLRAIEVWGVEKTLQRLTGMFSMALWDRKDKVLRLARDRFGEKPLYYGWQKGTFLFGSDLAAFAKNPDFEGTISRAALTSLLIHNNVTAPDSIFDGIKKLPPGCHLTLSADAFERRQMPLPTAYWSLVAQANAGIQSQEPCDEREIVDRFELLLKSVIKRQLVADVPVGAFLSGGIDSSAIVALAQSVSASRVKTFTIGFGEGEYNEAADAVRVAKHLGTDHTELTVTDRDALELIPSIPIAYSEPFADSSQIPTMLVSRLARNSVTVALSGDGGDEIFGGYNRYLAAEKLWAKIDAWPLSVRKFASKALLRVRPGRIDQTYGLVSSMLPSSYHFRGFGDKVHKFARAMDASSARDLHRKVSTFMDSDAGLVLRGAASPVMSPEAAVWPPANDIQSFVPWMMAQDSIGYLPDDILVKVDRAAMFYSLETRVPFLDHELIQAAWRLPQQMKIRNGQSKWLLREILYRHVPRQMIERPKMGFGVPLEHWLRGPLKDWANTLLDARSLKDEGFFDASKVQALWQGHLSGQGNWQHHLWPILMFQQWRASDFGRCVSP